jgi:hypothetical protein
LVLVVSIALSGLLFRNVFVTRSTGFLWSYVQGDAAIIFLGTLLFACLGLVPSSGELATFAFSSTNVAV